MSVYSGAAKRYRAFGWWPVPVHGKTIPAAGATGYKGEVTDEKIAEWVADNPMVYVDHEDGPKTLEVASNITLRHQLTIAIDVDEYGVAKIDGREIEKNGVAELAAFAREHGLSPLPATWSSTARGLESGSRQYPYRIAEDVQFKTKPCPAVELCCWHHRHTVVAPTIHPGTGTPYAWYRPGEPGIPPTWGAATDAVPIPSELPFLPADWFEAFRSLAEPLNEGVSVVGLDELLATFPVGEPDGLIRKKIATWSDPATPIDHDLMKNAGVEVLMYGREGRPGVPELWQIVFERYADYVRAKRPNEYERDLFSSEGIVGTVVRIAQQKKLKTLENGMHDEAAWRKLGAGATLEPLPPQRNGTGTEQQQSAPPSTWLPVNIAEILAEGYQPPTPTLLPRADGIGLIYPGEVHAIYGESESGKSWVAQVLVAQSLLAGERVLYVDHEDNAASVAGRLLALGVPRATLIDPDRYVYVRPDGPRDLKFLDLLQQTYAVAVVDGVNVAMSMEGQSSDSTDDSGQWYATVPGHIARRTGAATVTIDHVTKSRDARGRFAVGSQAKLAAISGSAFLARVDKPFGRGQIGTLVLRVTKDRPGGLRAHCSPADANNTAEAARVVLDATDPAHIAARVESWAKSAETRGELIDLDTVTAAAEDWWTTTGALPDDITSYTGDGQGAIMPMARFLRARAVDGIGVTMAETRTAIMERLRSPEGKPLHKKDSVNRAWGALVDMERLRLASPDATSRAGRSYWAAREGDPS